MNINAPPDSTATLAGVHWGVTTRGTHYAVFSPWSGIARDYPVCRRLNSWRPNGPGNVGVRRGVMFPVSRVLGGRHSGPFLRKRRRAGHHGAEFSLW